MNSSALLREKSSSVKNMKQSSSFADPFSPKGSPNSSQLNIGLTYELSASTLQQAPLTVKFPKAERFPKLEKGLLSQSSFQLPSTLSPKTTTFGYGNKVIMSEAQLRCAKEVPSPNHYNPHPWRNKNPGKTFGLSYSAYQKVYTPETNFILPELAKELPGPGAYKLPGTAGDRAKKYTLKARGKMFNEVTGEKAPPPNYYSSNFSLVESSRFRAISLGVGERSDFTKGVEPTPGPGSYKIPSKFDNMNKRKLIEEKLRQRLKGTKF